MERISHSKITTMLMCPRKFKFRYIDKAPQESTSSNLVFGIAVHKALESYMKNKKLGKIISDGKVIERFTKAFKKMLAEQLESGAPLDDEEGVDALIEKGRETIRTFLEYVEELLKEWNIHEVEYKFKINFGDEYTYVGVIDLVLQHKKSKKRFKIVDYKTAARSWAQSKIDHDMQSTIYLKAAQNFLPKGSKTEFEFWALIKTKQPKVEIYEIERDDRDWMEISHTVYHVIKAIKQGVFYRNRGWACGSCEYAQQCEITVTPVSEQFKTIIESDKK